MLRILRKKGVAKKILWVVAVIIIISFGFFGTAAYRLSNNGKATFAGKIFNKKVSFETFDKYYQHTVIQAMLHYGDNFKNMRSLLNLEGETWDRLILLKEADHRRIKVSDQEVIDAISSYPFFQRDGHFDNDLYQNILKFVFRTNTTNFEESMRDTLRLSKLYEQETNGTTLNESDIADAFKKEQEKIQVSYVQINPNQFKDQVPFDEVQAQKYYSDNKIEFLKPPSVKVDYIQIPFQTENHDAERAALKEKAKTVTDALAQNTSLADVAKQTNMELHTSGFFSIEAPDLSLGWSYDLLDKIFALKPNEITPAFETSTGFFIVQLKERKDSALAEYSEVKDKIKDILSLSKTKDIAEAKAKEFKKALSDEMNKSQIKNFGKTAKSLGLDVQQTPVFKRGEYLPKIGISKDFEEAAFALTLENPMSDVVPTNDGFSIIYLDNYVAPDQAEFAKEKETLTRKIVMAKKNSVFGQYLSKLRSMAKLEDNITAVKIDEEKKNQ